jgi:hypothetical protein
MSGRAGRASGVAGDDASFVEALDCCLGVASAEVASFC